MGVIKFVLGGLLILISFSIKDLVYYNAIKADVLFFCFTLILYFTSAVCGLMLIADSVMKKDDRFALKKSGGSQILYADDEKERKFF